MKTKAIIAGTLLSANLFGAAQAGTVVNVTVYNATHGSLITPIIAATHPSTYKMYAMGQAASDDLKKMAEGGDTSGLKTTIEAAGGITKSVGTAPFAAGAKEEINGLAADGNNGWLSLAGMILPTNDAFVAINGWKIPAETGTHTVWLHAYDAGSEVNNELLVSGGGTPGTLGMPGGTSHSGGTGMTTTETNTTVHIHPGVIGDPDSIGGKSDADISNHRWLNPIAKVVITVTVTP